MRNLLSVTIRPTDYSHLTPPRRKAPLATYLANHLGILSGNSPHIQCSETPRYFIGETAIDLSSLHVRGIEELKFEPNDFRSGDPRELLKQVIMVVLAGEMLPQALLSANLPIGIESTEELPSIEVSTPELQFKSFKPKNINARHKLSMDTKRGTIATALGFAILSTSLFVFPSLAIVSGLVSFAALLYTAISIASDIQNSKNVGIVYINEMAFPSDKARKTVKQLVIGCRLGRGMTYGPSRTKGYWETAYVDREEKLQNQLAEHFHLNLANLTLNLAKSETGKNVSVLQYIYVGNPSNPVILLELELITAHYN